MAKEVSDIKTWVQEIEEESANMSAEAGVRQKTLEREADSIAAEREQAMQSVAFATQALEAAREQVQDARWERQNASEATVKANEKEQLLLEKIARLGDEKHDMFHLASHGAKLINQARLETRNAYLARRHAEMAAEHADKFMKASAAR